MSNTRMFPFVFLNKFDFKVKLMECAIWSDMKEWVFKSLLSLLLLLLLLLLL